MTAAYTDDSPTIAQEQKQEKKTNATTIKTSSSSNKLQELQGSREESVENNAEERSVMSKQATGGQDKEETINPDHERPNVLVLSLSFESTESNGEQKEKRKNESSESESSESSFTQTSLETLERGQTSSCATNTSEITRRDIVDPTNESNEIITLVDRELDSVKPVSCDASVPTEGEEVITEDERRNVEATTRGLDTTVSKINNNASSIEDTSNATTMQLQELRHSLETVEARSKEIPWDLRSRVNDEDITSEEVMTNVCELEESYDPEGELNFHEAVRAGDAKCVAALLASGSVQNLDEPDWNVSGDPPLLVAATNHCLPVLSSLLANGCDPAVRSPRGETALHRVILNGGPGNVLKFVGELLKYGCPPGVKEAGGGLTALHVLTRQLAHAQGSKNLHHNFEAALKTLELLAQAGPVNAKDHQGRSALHILASSTIFDNNHRTEIELLIQTLLAAGADPSLKNDRGESPLHECLECGALNTAFLLIPHTPTGITSRYGETPLHIASRKNYVDMVAKLLEHGEDPSVQDAGGNTPLHLASARGYHQTVSLLVTSPLAQLEKLNIEGLTALQVAAESGFVNAVRLLLKAGADPSQTIHYCTTTLHRHPDISVLIDHELSRRRQLAA